MTPSPVSRLPSSGLFSLPELQEPSGFAKAAAHAMNECENLRQQVYATHSVNTRAEAVRLLFCLDAISKTVCNVIDAAELARNVHAGREWRAAAQRAFVILSDYIGQLNGDQRLYQALQLVAASPSIIQQLTTEEQRFLILLRAEFERDGIHLPDTGRDHVRQLQRQVTELEALFHHHLVHSNNKAIEAQADAVEDVLPRSMWPEWGMEALPSSGADSPSIKVRFSNDAHITQTLLKYSSNSSLRKHVYMESMTAVPENLPVLDSLVQVRHQLATTLGFPSYGHRFLSDKMAGSPAAVAEFLQNLSQASRPAFERDLQQLSRAKSQLEHNGSLEPWDISYFAGLIKSYHQGGIDIQHAVSEYLTLPNCIQGMVTLVQRLFGIHMVEEAMDPLERWDLDPEEPNIKSPHGEPLAENWSRRRGVRRFAFSDQDFRPLGIMYLDLFPRPGKYGHAAHFTVRCGCALTDGLDETTSSLDYQLPIIALVCNLTGGGNEHDILSHGEVETLFHEFGHALHSLLSRTKFQHMSGTRVAMDFVETPSHFMENFLWDKDFLQLIGFHRQTGQRMSDELIAKLTKSRYEFSSLERQNQIVYALFDQKLFGSDFYASRQTTTQLFAQLHAELGVPYAPGTHWHSRFGHLVSYGAGYYSYLYCQVFAGDIWRQCFQGHSLSREAGERFWKTILIHGGARDPKAMLLDLLGRTPRVDFT